MSEILIKESFKKLENYCAQENWKGWDPYDGLNSGIFKALPFISKNQIFRMAWIQIFKHSPFNLRRFFLVPKGYNSKGLGLFLTGYCNLYQIQKSRNDNTFNSVEDISGKIRFIADTLLSLQSKKYSGACWGYNFNWQSKAFFLPNQTPTVVATAFVVESLIKAYEVTGEKKYLETALSSANFIKQDLKKITKPKGFMFSYSPIDNQAVYNASLLGTKTLSLIYSYTGEIACKELAYESAYAVCQTQNQDGSFPHSDQVGNNWRDNFHTAFKLESLAYYQKLCLDNSFDSNLKLGYSYWVRHFFDHETGLALYYENNNKLIDLHCAAQSVPTLYNLSRFQEQSKLATKIMEWAVINMQDKKGYFYFQKRNNRLNKIPYMRWPNAWMFYGLSYYLLGVYENY